MPPLLPVEEDNASYEWDQREEGKGGYWKHEREPDEDHDGADEERDDSNHVDDQPGYEVPPESDAS